MIEKVKGLKIKGGIFESQTDLLFFQRSNAEIEPNFSLVYGKNGSGKSTISRGFNKLNDKEDSHIEIASLLDENREVIDLEKVENIHVFNEKFIEKNISIRSDGLNTIIVMGAEKELDDRIQEVTPKYERSVEEYSEKQNELEIFNSKNTVGSPNYIIEKIKRKLKDDGGWAKRDSEIKGNKINTNVTDTTVHNFINIKTKKTILELSNEFSDNLSKLKEAKEGRLLIDVEVPKVNFRNYSMDVDNLVDLLSLTIERPFLNNRERMIINLLEEVGGNQKLFEIKNFFGSSGEKICPFCFQNVSENYSNELVESIEKILNDRVSEHIKQLEMQKFDELIIDFSPYSNLPKQLVSNSMEKLSKFNEEIIKVNKLIDKKINNVYEPINEEVNLVKYAEKLSVALNNLEEGRKRYNDNANNIKDMVTELTKINRELAFLEIKDLLLELSQSQSKHQNLVTECNDLKNKMDSLKADLEELNEEKKNVRIAMKHINKDLSYIFFSKNRLKIDFSNDKYILYSNQKSVTPENISIGERNALGLCYFFNNLMNNKEEDKIFGQDCLLVIDDPVSSFDMENRIGILSYLKYKLGQYIKGNDKSKFIILTHDLQTFYDLEHLIAEICSSVYDKSEIATRNKHFKVLELSNKEIREFNFKDKNEYTKLMEIVYDFANGEELQSHHSIGNIMRKVLEAFGTFVYKKGISQLSTDASIKSPLSDSESEYFENFMYRLVLNTGSHLEEKVQTTNDYNFFDFISPGEKKRTAKLILVFLYKLNPLHIKAHLKERSGSEENIKSWALNLNDIINETIDEEIEE